MVNSWIPAIRSHAEIRLKAAVAVLICLALGSACRQAAKTRVSAADSLTNMNLPQDTVADPARFQFVFGDSVNRAFFWDQVSVLEETKNGGVRIDGLSVLYIEKADVPFALHTSLMDVEVLELPLLLQVDAYDREAGQSLELFSGALKVEKSYESSFPSLDTLHAGDLYMINKDIDLSEKEHLDEFTVLYWWESYAESQHINNSVSVITGD